MEKSIINKLTIGIISIILSIIVIAVQINVIKTAIELDRTPPVYLLQTYTVVLAVAIISYLVYYSISQGVDVYRMIITYKKEIEHREFANRMVSEGLKKFQSPSNPNPIDNTIDQVNNWKKSVGRLGDPDWVNPIAQDLIPIDRELSIETNPIDLKFDPLEDKAKEVLDNLKKKRDVQK